jgi:Immune inhibitor A-like, MAM domain
MNQSRLFVPLSLALALSACSGTTAEDPASDDDASSSSNGGGGAGGMATGGTTTTTGGMGGAGGSTGPCEMDCSSIQTPDCSVAVCNEGQYPGTIGECIVVDEEDGVGCDDGLFCTVSDTCQSGACTGGPPNDCGTPAGECEAVTCDESSQTCSTAAANEGGGCTPVDLCDTNGSCTNGLCVGTTIDCLFAPVPNECHIASCNPMNGMCEPEPDPTTAGQPCVDENDLCSDGNTCGAMGACSGGAPKDCSALDVGCTVGVCDAMNGTCVGQAVPMGGVCSDGIGPCETGSCDASMNCVAAPVMNGTPCDDFSTCTSNDACSAGVCAGTVDPMCTIFFEAAFETCPPSGWVLNPEWECGTPTNVGPAAAFMGTGVLGTDLDDDYDSSQNYASSYAQTPPISLATAAAPVLSYYHYLDSEGSVYDGYNLKISTDGGQNFSVLTTVDPPYNLTINAQPAYGGHGQVWEFVTASLAAYQGQQVILRWSFRSDTIVQFPGIYIDEIAVSNGDAIPVIITTPTLPNTLENVAYGVQVTHSGGSGNGVWSIEAGGANDGWLSINPSTGDLTGTPLMGNVGPVTLVIRHTEPSNPTNFDEAIYSFNVQTTVYIDDIEAPCPGNWTLGGDWQCGAPTTGPNMAFGGTQVLGTQLAGNYNNNQSYATATASSGPISLAGTTAPQLNFQVWYDTEGSVYDGFNVKVSTDGVNYTLVSTVTPAYNLTVGGQTAWGGHVQQWTEHIADLSAYAGQSVYVQFGFRSDSSVTYPGVYIDNVAITD